MDTATVSSVKIQSTPIAFWLSILTHQLFFLFLLAILCLPGSLIYLASGFLNDSRKRSLPEPTDTIQVNIPVKYENREVWIELLRFVGCLGIILLHIAAQFFQYIDPATAAWHVVNIAHGITRYGVPIFLMISGALYFSKPAPVSFSSLYKRILNFFIHYVFWALFYGWLGIYLWGPDYPLLQMLKEIVKNALTNPKGPLWYLLALIEFLMLLPVIKPAIRSNRGKQICEYILAIWLIFAALKTTVKYCWFLPKLDYLMLAFDKISAYSLGSWMGFCVLGYYLYQYGLPWRNTKLHRGILYAVGAVAILLGIHLTSLYCTYSGNIHESFYDNFSIAQVLFAVAVFYFFKNTVSTFSFRSDTARQIVSLSSLTMGVYLIHSGWINFLGTLDVYSVQKLLGDPITVILVTWFFTTVLSFVSVYFLKKIPILRKYIV